MMVDRETAAKLLEHAGHRDCLEQAGLVEPKRTFASLSQGPRTRRATVLAERKHVYIEGVGLVLGD